MMANRTAAMSPKKNRHAMKVLILVVAMSLLVGGCFLRFALSTVTVNSLGEFIEVTLDFSFNDVMAGVCLAEPGGFFPFMCRYTIETEDGGVETISSGELLGLGLFGVLIDPLIVQFPETTVVNRARVDDGTVVRDLIVTEATSFEAQPGVELFAEAGQKFLIFEFPVEISSTLPQVDPSLGPEFDFDVSLTWTQATDPGSMIPIKALFAGRVDLDGQTYYPPLLPCVTDFADVPVLEIPVGGPANIIFNLLFHFFDNPDMGCAGTVYDFTPVDAPLACDADADDDVDSDDIDQIVALRNTPASGPGDPLDADGNGTINILDARQCALDCTLPDCEIVPFVPACGLGFEIVPVLGGLAWVGQRRRRSRQRRREEDPRNGAANIP